jgi:hypothetical protein
MIINGRKYDVQTGDVFVSKSGKRYVITHVSRGDAYYRTESGDQSMIMVEKLFRLCTKEPRQ